MPPTARLPVRGLTRRSPIERFGASSSSTHPEYIGLVAQKQRFRRRLEVVLNADAIEALEPVRHHDFPLKHAGSIDTVSLMQACTARP
jgi:hypothetical protein